MPQSTNRPNLIKRLFMAFKPLERLLLGACLVLALIAGGLLGRELLLGQTKIVPAPGGTYTEGVVASSLADVTPTLDVLTKLGLTQYSVDGELVPAVADRWEVADDGKTYTFYVREDVDITTIRTVLDEQRALFPDIEINVTEDRTVVFRLNQPFTPFLATTSQPIFPYGPFTISEQQKGVVRLKPNSNSRVGQPYLQELTLRIYPDSFNLSQALDHDEIEGVSDITFVENSRLLRNLNAYDITLPRKIYLFFNTERDVVKSVDLRRALRDGQAVEGSPELTLVTLASPKHDELARQIVEQWKDLGVRVTVETHTATELANDIVPNRSYDVLIYGLDFGGDPDPYPFWHSSQIGTDGLNLSNFAHIDADRILEKARQTQNADERNALYGQFQEIFDREVPAVELEQVVATFAVDPGIQGIQPHAGLSLAERYAFVESWYRKTKRTAAE